MTYNIRSICAEVIFQVFIQKNTLNMSLSKWQNSINSKDRKLLYEITYGSIRMFNVLNFFVEQIVKNSLRKKIPIIHFLLIVGIYQLYCTRIPEYAIISETVNAAVKLNYLKFKKLVNAVLRTFQKKKNILYQQVINTNIQYMYPLWLLKKIQISYPVNWKNIIIESNKKAPLWIRVNKIYNSATNYLKILENHGIQAELSTHSECAIKLNNSCVINQLPGFYNGWISVQDISSQKCIELLNPKNYEDILDLCAAPGVKTTYILEIAPKANVLAVDISDKRLKTIQENLDRLNLHANIILGDGSKPYKWLTVKKKFDRILLDVPCSCTGIIRRHPDIKWLKNNIQLIKLIKLQYDLLSAIWPFLKTKGILAYITCSILPDENKHQIEKFLFNHKDAMLSTNIIQSIKQILPGDDEGDGFFYAFLSKK